METIVGVCSYAYIWEFNFYTLSLLNGSFCQQITTNYVIL